MAPLWLYHVAVVAISLPSHALFAMPFLSRIVSRVSSFGVAFSSSQRRLVNLTLISPRGSSIFGVGFGSAFCERPTRARLKWLLGDAKVFEDTVVVDGTRQRNATCWLRERLKPSWVETSVSAVRLVVGVWSRELSLSDLSAISFGVKAVNIGFGGGDLQLWSAASYHARFRWYGGGPIGLNGGDQKIGFAVTRQDWLANRRRWLGKDDSVRQQIRFGGEFVGPAWVVGPEQAFGPSVGTLRLLGLQWAKPRVLIFVGPPKMGLDLGLVNELFKIEVWDPRGLSTLLLMP